VKAAANGVDDLVQITADAGPSRNGTAAALRRPRCNSPSTGIVDSHALMLSLLGDLENAGGMLALKSPITRAECSDSGAIVLTAEDGTALRCRSVVNAAGLGAPALARRFEGLPSPQRVPTEYFAKGNYFTLSGRAPFSRLIYPVPEPGGLGVHLTIDLGGQAKFGPDVQWVAFGR
jgi:L-2-hydroxyglutarate oxidase LhgO